MSVRSPSFFQHGSVLLSVVVAIALLAAVTFMLSYDSVSETNITASELERDRLRYVTEAGLAHAKLQLARKTSCSDYADLPETNFSSDSYSAAISPNAGSPVTISVTGKLKNGISQTVGYTPIQTYEAPTTVVLQLSKDTGKDVHIDDFYPNANYGSIDDLTVRSGSWIQRPLLEFDLSAIPAGVNIVSAILDLELRTVTTPGVIGVHRMTRSWLEGTGKGTGNADGATWNDYDGNAAWSQPGGDFDGTLYASAYVSSAKNGGRVTWDIRDLVDGWVSGRFPNYGLMLADDGVVNNAEFQSREEPDPAAAPRLTIVYACECGKSCSAAPAAGKNVLLVVGDTANLTVEQADKKALMEGWGHTISLIATSASQAEFDNEAAKVDVVYIPELGTTPMTELGDKADDLSKGVITEEARTAIKLGGFVLLPFVDTTSINVIDNTHYISETLPLGNVVLSTATQSFWRLGGTLAPDLHVLGEFAATQPALAYVDVGETVNDGGPAAGRRVKLPWGSYNFDVNLLTDDALDIMQRAIEWGAADTTKEPIAHWKFDEGTGTLAADSVGGHDGTLQNGPAWTSGHLAGALEFDGTDDVVVVPHDDQLNLSDAFTLTAWINKSSVDYYDQIFNKGQSGYDSNYFFGTIDGDLTFGWYNGAWIEFKTTGLGLQAGSWYHIAGVFDNASDNVQLYLDGVEVLSDSTTLTPPTNSGNLRIGNPQWVSDYHGILDDLRIYDTALTAADVANLYAEGAPSGPIAHWKLDDAAGLIAVDSVGGHDGTLLNMTESNWGTGQIDGGLDFPGNNDYVNVPHDDALSLTDLTISLWLKTPTLNTVYQTMVRKKQQANYQLTTWDDEIVFAFNDGSGMKLFQTTNANLTTNTWHHVAATLDDTTGDIDIYLDGNPIYSTTTTYHPLPNTEPLTLGGVPDSSTYWPGMLDDIRLYDRVLTAAEVADQYTAGSGGGGGGGGGSCDGNFRDNFDTRVFNGSNGSLTWATDWIEVGESNGPTSGDIQVLSNLSNNRLRTRDNDNGGEGAEREADLSGAATATLNYDYRRMNLDSGSDYTSVEISANGAGGPWTELTRHSGSGNDSNYQPASHPITPYISANTRIRFKTSSTMGGTDTVWFDNVEIVCSP